MLLTKVAPLENYELALRDKSILLVPLLLVLLISAALVIGRLNTQVPPTRSPRTLGTNPIDVLDLGGIERLYRVHEPARHIAKQALPVIIALHGEGQLSADMEQLTALQFDSLGDAEGFITVYPEAIGGVWSVAHKDLAFIRELITQLETTYTIDRQRVYLVGFSNGGVLAYHAACALGDYIAAVAVVAAPMARDTRDHCSPQQPMPVLMMFGTDDPLLPIAGGETELGLLLSAEETATFWQAHNRCDNFPLVVGDINHDVSDETSVRQERYHPCDDKSEVLLYTVIGGGHTWPGGAAPALQENAGRITQDINAVDELWAFFRRHTLVETKQP